MKTTHSGALNKLTPFDVLPARLVVMPEKCQQEAAY
jgi:hypothetical protein